MIQIDLITGFLGSGKTTFLKKYATHLMEQGLRIGILENDYGAVNVDMMLLQDLEGEQCCLEMVAGGCDADCHQRRFKTKLIAMGMQGFDRVLVEPSGIFDVDEFFDSLYEEPLCRWYEIGNVIAIVDAGLETDLSLQSEYLLASQIANAGSILLSRSQEVGTQEINQTIFYMQNSLSRFQCKRDIKSVILTKDWDSFTQEDYETVFHCGYEISDFVKQFSEDHDYTALYFMHIKIPQEALHDTVKQLMNNTSCGRIFRIKGFMQSEDNSWVQLNATHKGISIKPIPRGQEILIIIGENLNEEIIRSYLWEPPI